ncbi:hypothetical protein C0993_012621 [Termitomyces sp. T159_Od127]|nr:hypothetical protein C0993_012621 [Termitomyces sp. T159_Od127]
MDRNCPEFKKCCVDFDAHYPENQMPYFFSNDAFTWVTASPCLPQSTLGSKPPAPHPPQTTAASAWPWAMPTPAPPTQPSQKKTPSNLHALSHLGNLDEFGFTSQPGDQRVRRSENPPPLVTNDPKVPQGSGQDPHLAAKHLKITHTAQTELLASANPDDWDVIALQEPYLNYLGNTYEWILAGCVSLSPPAGWGTPILLSPPHQHQHLD